MRYQIYKRDKSPYYWVRLVTNDSKVIRESSKCKRKRDVLNYVNKRISELERGDIKGKYSTTTLGDMVEAYRDYMIVNDKKSIKSAISNTKHLLRFFGDDKRMAEISHILLIEYRTWRKEGLSNGKIGSETSINRELTILCRLFNYGIELDFLNKKPSFPKKLKEPVRQDFFDKIDFETLLTHLPDYMIPVVKVAWILGMRKANIINMTWDEIDIELGSLDIRETKTGEPLGIKLPKDLRNMFQDLYKKCERDSLTGEPTNPYIFKRNGSRIKRYYFYKDWRQSLIDAGLVNKSTGEPNKYFHSFRRSAIRNMIRAGVHQDVAMKISGHKSAEVFRRYNIIEEKDIQEALEKTEKHLERI